MKRTREREDSESESRLRREVKPGDRLDSNLKLVNARLRILLDNDKSKLRGLESRLEKIDAQLDEIDHLIHKNNKNDNKSRPQQQQQHSKRKPISRVLKIYALVLLIALSCYFYGHLKIYIIYAIRLFLLAISPVINVFDVFEKNCLLLNPLYAPESSVTLETCQKACQSSNSKKYFLKEFTTDDELNERLFDKLVIEANLPIVDNVTAKTWTLSSKNIAYLLELYRDSLSSQDDNTAEALKTNQLCYFDSSLTTTSDRHSSIESMLDKFLGKLKNPPSKNDQHDLQLSWENCGRQSSKIVRKFSKRPEYLGQNIEIAVQNWIFISINNSPGKNSFFELPISFRIIFFCQIFGESRVRLKPVDECVATCRKSDILLKQGQILIFSSLWTVKFKPSNDDDNLVMLLLAHE